MFCRAFFGKVDHSISTLVPTACVRRQSTTRSRLNNSSRSGVAGGFCCATRGQYRESEWWFRGGFDGIWTALDAAQVGIKTLFN